MALWNRLKIAAFLFGIFSLVPGFAESPDVPASMFGLRGITGDISYSCMPAGTPLSEVRASHFMPVDKLLNLGYRTSADCWSRIQLINQNSSVKTLYLEADHGETMDTLEYFHFEDGRQIKTDILGFRHPHRLREISYRLPVIPLDFRPGQHEILVRQASRDIMFISWRLHERETFYTLAMKENLFLGGFFAICLTLSLYNLAIFAVTRDWSLLLYFLYFGGYGASQLFLSGLGHQYISDWLPSYAEGVGLSAICLTILCMLVFVHVFLDLRSWPRWVSGSIIVFGVGPLTGLIMNAAGNYTLAAQISLVAGCLGSLLFVGIAIVASLKKHPMAGYFALAWVFLMTGNAVQVYALAGFLPSSSLVFAAPYIGASMEAILISYALAQKMKMDKIKAISAINQKLLAVQKEHIEELDRKVDEKTRDIRSIFNSVSQSLLTVSGNPLRINEEASREFFVAFRGPDGQPARTISQLFTAGSLSTDEIDLIENVLRCSIGEDPITFEFNAESLPRAFTRLNANGTKVHFEVDWNPIVDHHNVIEKILVSIRDVTDLKRLYEESHARDMEHVLAHQILAISHEKFPRIIKSLQMLTAEVLDLAEDFRKGNEDVSRRLSVALHTIKGNARTFGFSELAQKVHEVEDIFKAHLGSPKQRRGIGSLVDRVMDVDRHVKLIASVASEKLGRSVEASEISIKHSEIDPLIPFFRKGEVCSAGMLREGLEHLLSEIFSRRHALVSDVMNDMVSALDKMAKKSGKEIPRLQLEEGMHHSYISGKAYDDFTSVFMHLLTNAFDHGIEAVAERLLAGKAVQGTIFTEVSYLGAFRTQIRFRDDGRGLDLPRIKELGVERALLASSNDDPYAVAETIFNQGLSTASEISQTSGRGVGMCAIREILERSGGQIQIYFLDDCPSIDRVEPFGFIINLPSGWLLDLDIQGTLGRLEEQSPSLSRSA